MPAGKIDFIRRETCGMDPEGPPCSQFWREHARVPDYESHLGTFDVKLCTRCQMGLTDPYPSEATTGYLYDAKVSGDFDVIQATWIDRIKDVLSRRLLRRLAPAEPAKILRVLDYSCGNARFAALAHDLFPQAQVDAVDYQEAPPPLIATGRFPRLAYHEVNAFAGLAPGYDLIILRHVLEHTHRPVELVRLLGSKLSPRGVLYIEVPNLFSGGARVFGNKWKGYYVPRHIFHYSAAALHEIVTRAGLEGEIERNEMPLMGNMLEILFGVKKSNPAVQAAGILLHPLQLLIEKANGSSTCLNVKARRPAAEKTA
jgi:SAM-dependent methyltransferase